MKKSFFLICLLILLSSGVFAQNSADSANRNTAIRCFKLAESCMVGRDWKNALNQAELGLSYDDSISDLIYIKAVAQINLGESKYNVLQVINSAFEKDNWIGYSKNGARILQADLLSDSGKLKESLEVLDSQPLIFSADAEIIRIKNYYRIGTMEALNKARSKVNSSRRVYPADSRFANIFFLYELLFRKNAVLMGDRNKYDSDLMQIIADSYIAKLPDYSANSELEIIAAYFAEENVRKRLIAALDAKGNSDNPLFILLALINGYYSEQVAYEKFFAACENHISLDLLQILCINITEPEVREQLCKTLNEFDGYLYIDCDNDIQNEFIVKYSLGRPLSGTYDSDNDGLYEMNITCDFGVPLNIEYCIPKINIEYDVYPNVKTIDFVKEECTFNFLYNDFAYNPVNIVIDPYIQETGFDFYYPQVALSDSAISVNDLMNKSASIKLPLTERDDSYIIYTLLNGDLCFANFFEGENKYAFCDFSTGVPFTRYVDQDFDGYFESSEVYDIYNPDSSIIYEDNLLVEKVFSMVAANQNIYLKQVNIDRNANENFEYAEEFLGNNGRCCMWDYDDDGVLDIKYTKFPYRNGDAINEETIFYDKDGNKIVIVNTIDGIPIKLMYQEREVMIFAGENPNFYWLEDEDSLELESVVSDEVKNISEQGLLSIVEIDNQRVLVIKLFNDIFCKIVKED